MKYDYEITAKYDGYIEGFCEYTIDFAETKSNAIILAKLILKNEPNVNTVYVRRSPRSSIGAQDYICGDWEIIKELKRKIK